MRCKFFTTIFNILGSPFDMFAHGIKPSDVDNYAQSDIAQVIESMRQDWFASGGTDEKLEQILREIDEEKRGRHD